MAMWLMAVKPPVPPAPFCNQMLKDFLLNILFPKRCVGCGREGQYICKDCEIFLSEAAPSTEVISVWEYEGLMEKLIGKIKLAGCHDIVKELVGKALGKIELNLPKDAAITFVPMYKKREKERGFNQTRLIAEGIGESVNKKVLSLLVKTKDNRSQVGLGPSEKTENVKDVFDFREEYICPKNVLLVDDFWVSGATIKECSKVLQAAGAKNVWGFTLARIA